MENETQQLTPEELEIRRLQTQLEDAKKRQTTLLQTQADKAALALIEAKRKAEAEEEVKRKEYERRVAETLARKEAERRAEAQKIAAERAEQARLEREAEAAQEALRQKAKHDAAVKELQNRLFLEEQENIRIARELQLKEAGPKPEPLPPTLVTTPLNIIFNPDSVPAAPPKELSAAENAKLQAQKDAVLEAQSPRQRSHPSSQQVFDLQRAFQKHTGYSPNFDALLEVLSFHADNIVMAKMFELVPSWKQRPVSAAGIVAQLTEALEAPTSVPVEEDITPEDEVLKAQIAKYSVGGSNE